MSVARWEGPKGAVVVTTDANFLPRLSDPAWTAEGVVRFSTWKRLVTLRPRRRREKGQFLDQRDTSRFAICDAPFQVYDFG